MVLRRAASSLAALRKQGDLARRHGSRQVVSGWGAMAWAPSGVRAESSRAESQLAHLARTAGARRPGATFSVGVSCRQGIEYLVSKKLRLPERVAGMVLWMLLWDRWPGCVVVS